mmetsp:Transcript_1476/g.1425  ORF Transcript_1476/g.1425 Transcript_1476/m.1425 type:complete len:330 (-) Transcript_1476:55-1044(-)
MGYAFGGALCSAVIWIMKGLDVENPSMFLFGLLVIWFLMPICSFFLPESARVLYYCNSSITLAENVLIVRQYDTTFPHKFLRELERLKKEIDGSKKFIISHRPKYENFFSGYYHAFKDYQKLNSAMSIVIVLVQTVLLFIIRTMEPEVVTTSQDDYSKMGENAMVMFICLVVELAIVTALTLVYFFTGNAKNIWFTLAIKIVALILIILLAILKTGYIYFIISIESLLVFNLYCIYLRNLETTLSISRNALNSLMSIASNVAFIISFLLRNDLYDKVLLGAFITFIILICVSFYLEYYLYDEKYKDKNIGEYEREILAKVPKDEHDKSD